MNFELFKRAFIVFWPYILTVLITTFIVSSVIIASIRIAEHHIFKNYLPGIEGSEVQRLTLENQKLTFELNSLKEKEELHIKTLAGVRHLIRKGDSV